MENGRKRERDRASWLISHKYVYIRARKKLLRTIAVLISATGHVLVAGIYNLLSSTAYYIFPFPSARTSDGYGSLVGGMVQTLIL